MALTVEGRRNPVENRAPKVHPADELEVVRGVGLSFNYVEYRLVQHSDRPSDASDAQGLSSEHGEDERRHER